MTFSQVCELDIMNEPEVVHYILDEMLLNGKETQATC
jgi:AP-4 complex subunit sigma-1